MKALSIIGIVLSFFAILFSLAVVGTKCNCFWEQGNPAEGLGFLLFIISLFFLGFSITATVVSFKKKNETNQIN